MDIGKRILNWWQKSTTKKKIWLIVSFALVFQIGTAIVAHRYISRITAAPEVAEHAAKAAIAPVVEVEHLTSYSEFMTMAKNHRFKNVTVGKSKVTAITKEDKTYILTHENWLYTDTFPKDLHDLGIIVMFETTSSSQFANVIASIISIVVSLATFLLFATIGVIVFMQAKSVISVGWPTVVRDSKIRFSDVAGQEEPKVELEEIRTFLANPEEYARVGARPPRGVLLVGPPGTGKTMLAKALAGEVGASFISVSGSDFSAMFVGVGRNRVEKLFKKARSKAPCIIFIDEIDSLARKRGASSSDLARESDTTLNQLLIEMDGFKSSEGIIVVGATNRVDVFDEALLRRFDRQVQVGLPTISGRRQILDVHVKGRPLADDIDLDHVARGAVGFSGADLANLVNEAAILAARDSRTSIEAIDFDEARDKVMMGLKRESLVLDDEEKRLIAYHEGGHALVACKMKDSDPVHQATIIPRGRALGLVMRIPVKDRVIIRRSKLRADLTVLMAGRAAEEIVFGEDNISNGAASDIEHATALARNMVTQWGLDTKASMIKIDDENAPEVRKEIRHILDQHYREAKRLLINNRDALDALAGTLLERETVDGDDVRKIVNDASNTVLANAC